jgi:NAD(P)H-flavin reductase
MSGAEREKPSRDPMLPVGYRVASSNRELGDTWTVELEPAGGEALPPFAPGQFAMLYAFGAGEVPISVSHVHAGERLVHTVRAVGPVTRAICEAEPGDQLGVRGPFGNAWPLAEAKGGDVVVVSGGIGLAPLRPVLEEIVSDRASYGHVSLLHGARAPEEMLFPADLRRWQAAQIAVETTVDAAPAEWGGRVGLVTKLIPLAEFESDRTTALVCGPEVMMRFVAKALGDRGVPAGRIHISMERNMKCAVGHCGHCQLAQTFICKDGPVFPYSVMAPLMAVREL